MDHDDAHPLTGESVFLRLNKPDPTRVLYSGLKVQVSGWADHTLSKPWLTLLRDRSGPGAEYRRRMEGEVLRDPDVVAVTPIGTTTVFLVHDSEIRRDS